MIILVYTVFKDLAVFQASLMTIKKNSYFTAYTVQAAEKISSSSLADANSKALLVCNGPLEHYEFLIKTEELKNDEQQRKVMHCMQKLHESLKGYSISSKRILSKVSLSH